MKCETMWEQAIKSKFNISLLILKNLKFYSMSFRNYLIVISNIAGSIILGAESFSFQYQINTPPEIFDKYYFHPEANSQYFLDSTIIDIFEWKVASTNPDLIKINIIDEKWVKLNDFKSTIQFQENEFKSSPIMIRGCPIVKIQLIPWKNGENGELEYLKEEIYGREINLPTDTITAFNRFSERI